MNPPHGMTRQEVEKAIKLARAGRKPPNLSGKRMWADYTGLDFTSDFKSKSGPFTSEILGADFRNAKLRGCNFSRSDLASACLRGADLSHSNLSSANLYTALLEDANLTEADLSSSNLVSAELQGVVVEGANFSEARFGQTSIGGVDLSGALRLDEATHSFVSAIGPDTLQLTAAGLRKRPESTRLSVMRFLRNAGFNEDMLSVFQSWIGQPIEFYSVFLSHSSLDKAFARKLYDDLRALGVNCWFDEKQILPGDNILEFVDRGIKIWEKFILVCSRNSLSSRTGWWVEQELERAFAKERELRSFKGHTDSVLIPVTIDDYVFKDWTSRFRASVLDKRVGDFRLWKTPQLYAEALNDLRSAIDLARKRT